MKGIFEGLCQAKNAKMKMSIAPALAASANSGFRPPAEDNKTIVNGARDCLRKPWRAMGGEADEEGVVVEGGNASESRGPLHF